MYTDLQLYIDGEWLNGKDRKSEEVHQSGDRQVARHFAACHARPISTAHSPPPTKGSRSGAR